MAYLLYGVYINHSIWYKLNDLTRFGAYITVAGAIITIILNIVFIPKYGYMASAWAHVASYGSMIIISFILARKYYWIDYQIGKIIPYFVIAVVMVIFSLYFNYPGLICEIVVNTIFILLFLAYAEYKDKLISVLAGKKTT
jgi:O-antigen/teichoic acid export membrane protein